MIVDKEWSFPRQQKERHSECACDPLQAVLVTHDNVKQAISSKAMPTDFADFPEIGDSSKQCASLYSTVPRCCLGRPELAVSRRNSIPLKKFQKSFCFELSETTVVQKVEIRRGLNFLVFHHALFDEGVIRDSEPIDLHELVANPPRTASDRRMGSRPPLR
jgi:hypothetical protein